MKVAKSGRVVAIAIVMALGIAGSIYTGYWSRMERYMTSIVSPASVEVPAWVKSAQGLQGAQGNGGVAADPAAGEASVGDPAGAAGAAGAAYHGAGAVPVVPVVPAAADATGEAGGQPAHGRPQPAGFNASLLPIIAGYATVLGLFASLVRLAELLGKRRLAARSVVARFADGAAARREP